jgi:hypothetical protein
MPLQTSRRFLSDNEDEFWREVYIAAIRGGYTSPVFVANRAIVEWRYRQDVSSLKPQDAA